MRVGPIEKDIMKKREEGTVCFALIDSENLGVRKAARLAEIADEGGAGAILVGGSTVVDQIELNDVIKSIKKTSRLPVILFPGNITGLSQHADAVLFMSLLNSDNPYFITEAQALSAFTVKKYGLEPLPTAYLIVGDGGITGFIGRARGIPPDKPEIAAMYSLAAQYLGMRFLYLEAGSGVKTHVSLDTISVVRKAYSGFLIVGGGIKDAQTARNIVEVGADAIVIGTLLENRTSKTHLLSITQALH